MEVFKGNGDGPSPAGLELRDAGTGKQLFARPSMGRRELLDGARITKWDYENRSEERLFDGGDYGCISNRVQPARARGVPPGPRKIPNGPYTSAVTRTHDFLITDS